MESLLEGYNIPKFKDRANWSRDTVQPMIRRACVYPTIGSVVKNFYDSGRKVLNKVRERSTPPPLQASEALFIRVPIKP